MKKFSDFLNESSGSKVISDKLKDMKSLKDFIYPTPEERRAQIAKEKKDVKESAYSDFKASGKSDAEWEEHRKLANAESKEKNIKRVVDSFRKDGASGIDIHNVLLSKGVSIDHSISKGLQHDNTKISETGVSGKMDRKEASKIHKFVSTHINKHFPKIKESEDLDEENQEHQYIMQSLADKDINSHIKDGKVVVHKDNASKAKSHLKKIGHGDLQVVHEGFEELEEGMKGYTQRTLDIDMAKLGWHRGDGTRHDKYFHPKADRHIAMPRHAGELSRPTTTKMMKQAKQFIRAESVEIMSFKEFLEAK